MTDPSYVRQTVESSKWRAAGKPGGAWVRGPIIAFLPIALIIRVIA